MLKRINCALFISFVLHIVLLFIAVQFLGNPFVTESEGISAEVLGVVAKKHVKRRVLQRHLPRALQPEALAIASVDSKHTPQRRILKAPVYADVTPDIVTHVGTLYTDEPSPVSNTSFGEDRTAGGPVTITGRWGKGNSGAKVGRAMPGYRGEGIGRHFAKRMNVSDIDLGMFSGKDAGLGIFSTEVMPGHGLIGQVFVPDNAISRMPDFERLTPVHTFVTANLNVPVRPYTRGFPMPGQQIVIENFAICFRGELAIRTPGVYIFELHSDDGSKLYIDGTLVIDNDGVHPAMSRQGRKTLTMGAHSVEIHYFQGPRHAIALQWFYHPPNQHKQVVPPGVILRPGKPK